MKKQSNQPITQSACDSPGAARSGLEAQKVNAGVLMRVAYRFALLLAIMTSISASCPGRKPKYNYPKPIRILVSPESEMKDVIRVTASRGVKFKTVEIDKVQSRLPAGGAPVGFYTKPGTVRLEVYYEERGQYGIIRFSRPPRWLEAGRKEGGESVHVCTADAGPYNIRLYIVKTGAECVRPL